MNPDPITTTKNKTLVQAIRHMKQTKVATLLVVNEEQVLEGFIDVAVIDQKRKKTTLVAEAFETEMFTVTEGTFIRDAIRQILKKGKKYIPVIDKEKRLIGRSEEHTSELQSR